MDQKMMSETKKTSDPTGYLKKPYARLVVPEQDGTFRAEIMEFPGCIAVGDTASEALATLEEVAKSWLEATLAKGQVIPEPMENIEFSGKLVLRLPKSLHKKAAHAAERDGVSLNQFIVSSLAEHVGERRVTNLRRTMANVLIDLQEYVPSFGAGAQKLKIFKTSPSVIHAELGFEPDRRVEPAYAGS